MAIISSERVNYEVGQWVWTSKLISGDVAQTIASQWHSPCTSDAPITEFSHTGRISDLQAMKDCILVNGRDNGFPVDLAALMAWVAFVGPDVLG